MPDFVILIPILAPITAAFLLPFLGLLSKRFFPLLCILAMTVSLVSLTLAAEPVFLQGKVLVYWFGGWEPVPGMAIGINLAVDAWGLFIAFTVALVGFLSLLFSIYYLRDETGKEAYYVLMMLLISAMTGFVLTGDLFNQFVWLEILSFSAFALTAFHYQERIALEGAFKYFITNSLAAMFILVALALLYATTGALNLAIAAGEFGKVSGEMVALGLLFAGYATKTALVPWHFWLPDAYQAAPAPVAALFSGALSKIGIYAIGRLLFTLTPLEFNFTVREVFLGITALTIFVGGFQMLRQELIKRILAYSSISQMGYILMGLSIGTPFAIAAACVHILNHSLAKPALFFGAGTIQTYSGIRRLSEGSALIRKMPVTFGLMAFAGLSLSGIPLTIGFISKTMLEESALSGGDNWLIVFAVLGSIFTFAGLARLLWRVFFERDEETEKEKETPEQRSSAMRPLALFPMILPVILIVLIGVFPRLPLEWFAWPSAAALLQPGHYVASVILVETRPPNEIFSILPPPKLTNIENWITPLLIIGLGILLTIYSLPKRQGQLWGTPVMRWVNNSFRRWHSGYLFDYLLWISFSTGLLLILFILIFTKVI